MVLMITVVMIVMMMTLMMVVVMMMAMMEGALWSPLVGGTNAVIKVSTEVSAEIFSHGKMIAVVSTKIKFNFFGKFYCRQFQEQRHGTVFMKILGQERFWSDSLNFTAAWLPQFLSVFSAASILGLSSEYFHLIDSCLIGFVVIPLLLISKMVGPAFLQR